jgi:hypothetical protein
MDRELKGKAMKTKIITIMIAFSIAGIAKATVVDVNVATDKESYLLGEEVIVSVIAYNPNLEPVTLYFGSSLLATYLMDDVFDWSEGRIFEPVNLQLTIQPYNFHTFDFMHGLYEMSLYPLDFGTHTVVGEVVGYGQSAQVQFEVVPEPSSILLLSMGIVLASAKKRH